MQWIETWSLSGNGGVTIGGGTEAGCAAAGNISSRHRANSGTRTSMAERYIRPPLSRGTPGLSGISSARTAFTLLPLGVGDGRAASANAEPMPGASGDVDSSQDVAVQALGSRHDPSGADRRGERSGHT